MIMVGCDKQASCARVGAVDEDLVVDALRVWLIGDTDEPEVGESSVECPSADATASGDVTEPVT